MRPDKVALFKTEKRENVKIKIKTKNGKFWFGGISCSPVCLWRCTLMHAGNIQS